MSKRTKNPRQKSQSHAFPVGALYGILFAIALAAYWNSFNVPFVFDDSLTIKENAAVRFGEISWYLPSARSILFLTFTLNFIWSAQEVWGYHLVNFLLHFLNGVLVFVLAEGVFRGVQQIQERARTYAALAAAFFLVHPVQTESVTYISSRSELLSTFFYLMVLVIFASWPGRRHGLLCSLAVAIPFLLALGSKETAISLPAVLFVYDFLFWSGAHFKPMLSRWRFYLVGALSGLAGVYFILEVSQRRTVGSGVAGNLSTWQYFLTELRVLVRYVELVFLPIGLNLDYDFRPSTSLLEPSVIASLVFLCGLAALGWRLRQRTPVFAFSIFAFFITLAPTSSVVPVRDVIFEHRLYLPLVCICLSFPVLVGLVHEKLQRSILLPGRALGYSCLIILALIVGTARRNYIWGDPVRLFTDVVAKSPDKERPYTLLGIAYSERGEPGRAIEVLEGGLARLPEKVAGFSDSLGSLYVQSGRLDDAVALYKKTVPYVTGPRLALTYNSIGATYLYKWSLQAQGSQLSGDQAAAARELSLRPAIENFSQALQINPNMLFALDSYINASFYMDKGSELEKTALQKLARKPDFRSLYTVGKVAFNSGDYARADSYFDQAEKLQKDKVVFFNHGYALGALRQDDRAIEKYLQAIHEDPLFTEAYSNLGLIYMGKQDYNKAFDVFTEVLRQDPNHLRSNLNLAAIYVSRGDRTHAREHLQTVLATSPGNQEALAMLQQVGS